MYLPLLRNATYSFAIIFTDQNVMLSAQPVYSLVLPSVRLFRLHLSLPYYFMANTWLEPKYLVFVLLIFAMPSFGYAWLYYASLIVSQLETEQIICFSYLTLNYCVESTMYVVYTNTDTVRVNFVFLGAASNINKIRRGSRKRWVLMLTSLLPVVYPGLKRFSQRLFCIFAALNCECSSY